MVKSERNKRAIDALTVILKSELGKNTAMFKPWTVVDDEELLALREISKAALAWRDAHVEQCGTHSPRDLFLIQVIEKFDPSRVEG